MSFKKYFRFSLLLPYFMSAISAILVFTTKFGAMSGLFIFTLFSVVFAGIPYALFILLVFLWSKNRSDVQIKRAIWFLPILFLPFLTIVPFITGSSVNMHEILQSAMYFWGVGLVYGYTYVFLTLFGWFVVKKLGFNKV